MPILIAIDRTTDSRWRTAGDRKSKGNPGIQFKCIGIQFISVRRIYISKGNVSLGDCNSNTLHGLTSLPQPERSHRSGGETTPDCSSAGGVTTAQLAGRCELASFYQLLHHLRHLVSGETWKEVLPVGISAYFPSCLHQSWARNCSNQVFLKKETKQE